MCGGGACVCPRGPPKHVKCGAGKSMCAHPRAAQHCKVGSGEGHVCACARACACMHARACAHVRAYMHVGACAHVRACMLARACVQWLLSGSLVVA